MKNAAGAIKKANTLVKSKRGRKVGTVAKAAAAAMDVQNSKRGQCSSLLQCGLTQYVQGRSAAESCQYNRMCSSQPLQD